jgi:hypothetical protein
MKTRVKFYIATYEPIEEGEIATEEVVAVFVDEIQGVVNGERHFLSYAHLGQHCECSESFIAKNCREATEKEYKVLYNELTNLVKYNLEVL